jgi:hypothetical protein
MRVINEERTPAQYHTNNLQASSEKYLSLDLSINWPNNGAPIAETKKQRGIKNEFNLYIYTKVSIKNCFQSLTSQLSGIPTETPNPDRIYNCLPRPRASSLEPGPRATVGLCGLDDGSLG